MAPDAPSPEEALTPEEPLRYASALAQALRRLHQEGAFCGSLDPGHIVWSKDGVKLEPSDAGGLTPYLSPEQLREEGCDARSDIFAFGAIFYELLSGRRAFPADDPEELKMQILNREPAPIEGIPAEIAALLNRCLEKKPENRWQRVSHILIELKLASALSRRAHQALEWRERFSSLRVQIAGQDERLTGRESARELSESQLRQSIQTLQEQAEQQAALIGQANQTLAETLKSIAMLQHGARAQARDIDLSRRLHRKRTKSSNTWSRHSACCTNPWWNVPKQKLSWFRKTAAESTPGNGSGRPKSLAERLAAGPLSVAEALRYAIALGEALREIHHRGRIHGYLEPAGIAIVEGQLRLPPSAPSAVSPYFSPEQVAGSDLDARSDIFSLGAVLYEMLAGHAAFAAASKLALRMEILNRDPAELEDVPPAVGRLARQCLEKKPERRVQRMEILLARLKLAAIECGDASGTEGAPASQADSADRNWVCRACGSRDVHWSAPVSGLDEALMRLGGEIGRCYRCYYRFARLGWFTIGRPDENARPTRPVHARAGRSTDARQRRGPHG